MVCLGDTEVAIYLPLFALGATFVAGLVMLAFRSWRGIGLRMVVATLIVGVLEFILIIALVLAYSGLNPEWDLS